MPYIPLNTQRHTFDIPDDVDGYKRRVVMTNFTFTTEYEKFITTLTIEYSNPKKVPILDENDEPTGEYKSIQAEYADPQDYVVLKTKSDTFVGDRAIMVSLEEGRQGYILNPDRNPNIDTTDLYTSQYEFIYMMFSGGIDPETKKEGCVPLDLIEGLINNWDQWANLRD